MKVGLALDGLLVDIDSAFAGKSEASSYLDPSVIRDESFWATLKLAQNVEILREIDELFILTPRPHSLLLITRSWLKRNGIIIPDENIIMQSSGSLKRYDCRIYDLDYYIDSDDVLTTFKYDRCIPVGIGRNFPNWIRSFDDLASVRFEGDLRDWKCYGNEKM